ncbi:EARS2 [Bugula neritina]|uniref:Nondiscriminating glutamyl-tRNA synthetase EARS2, mitochondrial n=1 Tax=Bugula neritina TaxID=10212 RepID=A0A7J7KJI0_BUGNE|nr:EARS2 [Bugula neritina]
MSLAYRLYLRIPLREIIDRCPKCNLSQLKSSTHRSYSSNVRVRFAPSPTGELHLGGLRTALYNYLFARKHNGAFILRCEDTDQTRFVPGAMEKLIDLLSWIGMKPDEGPSLGGHYGPYVQSERVDIYKQKADCLIGERHAYRCFCTPQRLELVKKDQIRSQAVVQGYDNHCRGLSKEKVEEKLSANLPHVVRFKLNNDKHQWEDLVFGHMMSEDLSRQEGDPVILKTDGFPTYHLANVVDDHLMDISHVLRGSSTVLSYMTEYCAEYMTEYWAEYMTEYCAECMTEYCAEYMTEYCAECMTEYCTEYMTEYCAECMTEYCAECMTEYCAECMTEYCTEYMTEYCAECMTEYCAEYMTEYLLRVAELYSETPPAICSFGWAPPSYAHLPLLMNEDGGKLSKRQDSMRVELLKEEGYQPQSILSLLALAGGAITINPNVVKEFGVTLESAAEHFDIKKTRRENTVLEISKLSELNKNCLKRIYQTATKEDFCAKISEIATEKGYSIASLDLLHTNFLQYCDRLDTLRDLFEGDFVYLWQRPSPNHVRQTLANLKWCKVGEALDLVQLLGKAVLNAQNFDGVMATLQSQTSLKKSIIFKIIRVVVTGHEVGLPISLIFDLLDAGEIWERCQAVLLSQIQRQTDVGVEV